MSEQKQQAYQALSQQIAPKRPVIKNCCRAFVAGGLICVLGQLIQWGLMAGFDMTEEAAATPATAILILIATILTAAGVYDNIAQWAGAGSAVPVTGFANGITSAALEYRSEGFVLGVGCNMFKIAGPVIVYGVVASFIAALIQLAYTAIMGMGV